MWTVFLVSTQSPIITDSFYQTFPLQYLNIAKHRKKIPDGLIKTTQPEKIKVTRKSEPILLKSFFEAMKGPGDLICKFCAGQIGSK